LRFLHIHQVDYNAKNEYDMIGNYKVMQDVFNKLGIDKVWPGGCAVC
jgi:RP/EB family microtubule-associated protein